MLQLPIHTDASFSVSYALINWESGQFLQQLTVVQKEFSQNLQDTEYVLTVGYRIENALLHPGTKLNHFFVMTGWTEPLAPAAESEKIFMAAFVAPNPRKALLQVTAV